MGELVVRTIAYAHCRRNLMFIITLQTGSPPRFFRPLNYFSSLIFDWSLQSAPIGVNFLIIRICLVFSHTLLQYIVNGLYQIGSVYKLAIFDIIYSF